MVQQITYVRLLVIAKMVRVTFVIVVMVFDVVSVEFIVVVVEPVSVVESYKYASICLFEFLLRLVFAVFIS